MTTLGDLQFLFVDICLMTSLAIAMGRGGPSLELHSCRPPASLLALPVLGSIFLHTCMIILGQLAALFTTMSQEWCAAHGPTGKPRLTELKGENYDAWILLFFFNSRYIPLNLTRTGIENLPNMENSSVFVLSGFQYIIMAVVVTKSYPHKKPLYSNCEWTSKSRRSAALSPLLFTLVDFCCSVGIFFCLVLLLFAVMTWLVIYPGAFVAAAFQLYNFTDMEFKVLLLALAALNFFLCFIFEVGRGPKLYMSCTCSMENANMLILWDGNLLSNYKQAVKRVTLLERTNEKWSMWRVHLIKANPLCTSFVRSPETTSDCNVWLLKAPQKLYLLFSTNLASKTSPQSEFTLINCTF